MKKFIGIMLLLVTSVLALSSCSKDDEPKTPSKPSLNKTSLALYAGESSRLTYNGACTWSSDDENIATVSYGVVTAKLVGQTNIRANSSICRVTVKPKYTKYIEPYIVWNNGTSEVENYMRKNGFNSHTSSQNTLTYKVDDKTGYGYEFKNNKLTMSTIVTVSLTEAYYFVDFCGERYIPATKLDDGEYAFLTTDKKNCRISSDK